MATFQKYRGKPVVVEAVQLTATNTAEVKKLIGIGAYEEKAYDPVNLHIKNEHGIVIATPGDWIIRGSRGELYPCKDSTFQEKYEKAGV